jgi:quercetin dioxygenase-like cupin family protein
MTKHALEQFPLHLGLGARTVPQPEFTGMEWYAAYVARHAEDGNEGRLVSMHTFDESWTSWEMHPLGDEAVICTAGEITLHQELPGGVKKTTLSEGEYAINPRGVWHTADVAGRATALFITAGIGTEHRPR